MKEQVTARSPKNRYRVTFHYSKPIPGLGSVSSFGVQTLEGLENNPHYKRCKSRGHGVLAVMENKNQYPNFDWERIHVEQF